MLVNGNSNDFYVYTPFGNVHFDKNTVLGNEKAKEFLVEMMNRKTKLMLGDTKFMGVDIYY